MQRQLILEFKDKAKEKRACIALADANNEQQPHS
jgi:hypothetical protein